MGVLKTVEQLNSHVGARCHPTVCVHVLRAVNFNLHMSHFIRNGGKPRKQATLFLVLSVPTKKKEHGPRTGKQNPEKPAQLPICVPAGSAPAP